MKNQNLIRYTPTPLLVRPPIVRISPFPYSAHLLNLVKIPTIGGLIKCKFPIVRSFESPNFTHNRGVGVLRLVIYSRNCLGIIPPNHLLVEPRYYHGHGSKITLLPWPW